MSPVIDAHHHLWDPARREYPWMTGSAAVLRRPFGLAELRENTAAAGVDRTVVVQAVGDLDETAELLDLAAASGGLVAGVVGWVDLTASDVADLIARLRAGAGGDRLVGIRHQVHDEDDPLWLDRVDVRRGLAVLAEEGLVYDLLVRQRELPAAARAARDVDDLVFVVDHGAKPPIAAGASGVEPWASLLARLAASPNVRCKVSGLVTEARPDDWQVDDLRPYVEQLVDLFTPSRLMFGSDWPVCTLAASYAEVVEATRGCLAGLSEAERAAVFGGSAASVYGV